MSLFFRGQESRAVTSADAFMDAQFAGTRSASGVAVTPDKALRVGAMWSSAHLLASIVSNLPVDVFRGSGPGKQPVSPQPQVVAAPSLLVTRRDWTYQAMMSMLLRGNAIGLIVERDSLQRPKVVEWLDPDSVIVEQKSSLHRPTYALKAEGSRPLPFHDVVHLPAFLRPGSAIGMSPVSYHAETLGISLAAQKYGAEWFAGGGHPTALFQNKAKTIDDTQSKAIKGRISAILRGKREPLVLGSDWDYKPLQVSAAESEFVNTLGYADAQIARIYGPGLAEVLGYTQSGSSLTYSNRVDRSLDLLTYTAMPWVNKFEDFLSGVIAQPQTVRYNVNALLRADNKSRHEVYKLDREIGLYNVDELRGFEDEPPLPNGQGQDYTPLAAKSAAPSDGGQ